MDVSELGYRSGRGLGVMMLDVLGIGFGPANIALAISLEELAPHLSAKFLEARPSSQWQPEMMLPGADIQNHPLRDLVTPRNPQSFYTFTNFLKVSGRLFEHLNIGAIFPLRVEYMQYIAWVAKHFDRIVDYNSVATFIKPLFDEEGRHKGYEVGSANGKTYHAKSVVVAPGRTPYMPSSLAGLVGPVIHFTQLSSTLNAADERGQVLEKIVVVGASQSAAEIALELRSRYPRSEIILIHRCFGLRQKDLSPFTGEVFYPEFVDLYHGADGDLRRKLDEDLRYTNYSSADRDVLDSLYLKMYDDKITGRQSISIRRGCEITGATLVGSKVNLVIKDTYKNKAESLDADLVIAATGFRNIGPESDQERVPLILRGLTSFLNLDSNGCVSINRDYSLRTASPLENDLPLILNGLCEKSHGMGDAGSFSLLSLRAEIITNNLVNVVVRPLSQLEVNHA